MIGIIDSIEVDTRFDFKGKIVCDDGKYYYFNKMNWSNSNISMGDISVGSVVEFELKNPNASGVVYPKNIRFKGQTIQYSTSHSYGDFKQFVFVKTYLILPLLKKMSPDYCMDDANPEKSVFRKIAQNYNRLSNSDFVFTNTNNTDVLCFPSGYNTHDGVPIFLYCTKNIDPNKSTWESDRVLINNRVVGGSIFELINANWYDVEADIKTLLPQL